MAGTGGHEFSQARICKQELEDLRQFNKLLDSKDNDENDAIIKHLEEMEENEDMCIANFKVITIFRLFP
jgi:hypothetical protein